MRNTLIYMLAAVFALLSSFHFYWAAGGRFGSTAAVPSVDGKSVFSPSISATLLVAAALLAAMATVLGNLDLFGKTIPLLIFRTATFGIALLFLARAIGDFRLLGFFKTVRNTDFAFWDSALFAPVCLFVAVAAFFIWYLEA